MCENQTESLQKFMSQNLSHPHHPPPLHIEFLTSDIVTVIHTVCAGQLVTVLQACQVGLCPQEVNYQDYLAFDDQKSARQQEVQNSQHFPKITALPNLKKPLMVSQQSKQLLTT